MTEYNVKSEHAAEFIHDGEIRVDLPQDVLDEEEGAALLAQLL